LNCKSRYFDIMRKCFVKFGQIELRNLIKDWFDKEWFNFDLGNLLNLITWETSRGLIGILIFALLFVVRIYPMASAKEPIESNTLETNKGKNENGIGHIIPEYPGILPNNWIPNLASLDLNGDLGLDLVEFLNEKMLEAKSFILYLGKEKFRRNTVFEKGKDSKMKNILSLLLGKSSELAIELWNYRMRTLFDKAWKETRGIKYFEIITEFGNWFELNLKRRIKKLNLINLNILIVCFIWAVVIGLLFMGFLGGRLG